MAIFAFMKIRHLFFDLDNTLWDHRKNAYLTLKEIFKNHHIHDLYNIEFDNFYKVYDDINEDLWAKIRDAKIDKAYLRKHRFYDTFLTFNIDDAPLSEIFEYQFLDKMTEHNELIPGCIETLEYLHSKSFIIHIISNGFHEVTHRKVDQSGIHKYINTITSADDVGVRKPNSAIFRHALTKAHAEKQESLLIGDDWIADIKGAKNFGIEAIFFNALQEEFSDPTVRVITNLLDLKGIL